MKKIYILFIILFATAFGMVSCNKWLDIDPKLEIYEENLFEKEQGYYSALNGIYILLAEKELYGKELSWGAMEAWGKGYTYTASYNQNYSDLSDLNYEADGPRRIASSLWLLCYNVIAETNNLIQNIQKEDSSLFMEKSIVKDVILGEAYAIRALMHFELVRIFAQAPVLDNGGATAYIPFVDKFPSQVNIPVPTKDVLARIIRELESAKELVGDFDLKPGNPGYESYIGSLKGVGARVKLDYGDGAYLHHPEEFFRYRANRQSYYPITQLLARVCLYAGDYDKAYKNANEIVEMVEDGRIYTFVKPTQIGDPLALDFVEPRLHSEILFGTYNSDMEKYVKNYFDPAEQNGDYLFRVNDLDFIFNSDGDCRRKAIQSGLSTKYSMKGKSEEQMTAAKSLVPVLRFPESYYIAAESILDKDKNRAVELFNKAVRARGNNSYEVNVSYSRDNFIEAIVQEYRREFLSEGVMIFVYKRLNLPFRENGFPVEHNGSLFMPIPDSEEGIN